MVAAKQSSPAAKVTKPVNGGQTETKPLPAESKPAPVVAPKVPKTSSGLYTMTESKGTRTAEPVISPAKPDNPAKSE